MLIVGMDLQVSNLLLTLWLTWLSTSVGYVFYSYLQADTKMNQVCPQPGQRYSFLKKLLGCIIVGTRGSHTRGWGVPVVPCRGCKSAFGTCDGVQPQKKSTARAFLVNLGY